MSTIAPARPGRTAGNADTADTADTRLRQGYGGQVAGNDDQLIFPHPLIEAYLELRRFKNLLIEREVIFELGKKGVTLVFSFY